jgi:hypothetical protein
MSFDKTRARATLEELLELAGVPQPKLFENREQQEEIEADYIEEDLSEAEDEPGEEPEEDEPEAEPMKPPKGKKKEEPEDEDEPEEGEEEPKDSEELHDTWTVAIKTGGKFKFEMYENYFYVWYRSKKSERIDIPPKFKAFRKEMAKLFNEIMTYVEKAS